MLRFCKGGPRKTGRIGVFPGAFNPLTTAHVALARAAQAQYKLNQVVFVLPQSFPHKEYEGISFDDRIAMLADALGEESAFAIASSRHGLFIEIARAFRVQHGPRVHLYLVCGRDAAERIVNWDYGDGPPFRKQLQEFSMLVASRKGSYRVAAEYEGRIHPIEWPALFDEVSSSAVREAIQSGGPWRRLVPEAVARRIAERKLYRHSAC